MKGARESSESGAREPDVDVEGVDEVAWREARGLVKIGVDEADVDEEEERAMVA